MKHQALFSSKDKNKKVSSAAILLGVLRVNKFMTDDFAKLWCCWQLTRWGIM